LITISDICKYTKEDSPKKLILKLNNHIVETHHCGRPDAGIPKPVWAVGFAPEQPLRDATLTCSTSGILKQLEHVPKPVHFIKPDYHKNNINETINNSMRYTEATMKFIFSRQDYRIVRI
jgi:hypothetical protein